MQHYVNAQLDASRCKMDVVFTLDGSSTIKDHPLNPWDLITGFTQDLAKQINISPAGSHAGLVLFTEVALIKLTLKDSESVVLETIAKLGIRGGKTNTTDALYKSRQLLTDPQRAARQGVPKIVVLVTDGNPDPEELESNRVFIEAQDCRDAGIRVIVIGVGNVNKAVGTRLSYQTDDYIHVERFDQLEDVKVRIITEEVCEPVSTTTTTTTPAPTTTTPKPTTTTPEPTPEPTTTTPEPTTTTPEPTPEPTTTTPEPTTTTPEPTPEPTTTTPEPTTTTPEPTPEPTTTTPEPTTTTPEPTPEPTTTTPEPTTTTAEPAAKQPCAHKAGCGCPRLIVY
jgi:hypothetical protein